MSLSGLPMCVFRPWPTTRWTTPGRLPRRAKPSWPGYRNSEVRSVSPDPKMSGVGPIGQMGYCRPRAQALWNDALD